MNDSFSGPVLSPVEQAHAKAVESMMDILWALIAEQKKNGRLLKAHRSDEIAPPQDSDTVKQGILIYIDIFYGIKYFITPFGTYRTTQPSTITPGDIDSWKDVWSQFTQKIATGLRNEISDEHGYTERWYEVKSINGVGFSYPLGIRKPVNPTDAW